MTIKRRLCAYAVINIGILIFFVIIWLISYSQRQVEIRKTILVTNIIQQIGKLDFIMEEYTAYHSLKLEQQWLITYKAAELDIENDPLLLSVLKNDFNKMYSLFIRISSGKYKMKDFLPVLDNTEKINRFTN